MVQVDRKIRFQIGQNTVRIGVRTNLRSVPVPLIVCSAAIIIRNTTICRRSTSPIMFLLKSKKYIYIVALADIEQPHDTAILESDGYGSQF